MRRSLVTDKEFVACWKEAVRQRRTSAWVAEELGTTRLAARSRATSLRRRGTRLGALGPQGAGVTAYRPKQARARASLEVTRG